jgi:hypothetical protein
MMDNPEKQGTRQTKLQSNKTCNTKTIRNTEHTKQPAVNLGPHLIVSRFWIFLSRFVPVLTFRLGKLLCIPQT